MMPVGRAGCPLPASFSSMRTGYLSGITKAFTVFLTSNLCQPSLAECDTPDVARIRPWNHSGPQRVPSVYLEFASRRVFSTDVRSTAKSQDLKDWF